MLGARGNISANSESPMQPVRFGLIGFGAWGSHHARAIAGTSGAELIAVAARSEESRAAAHALYPRATAYANYRDLLRRDDIDVVDVVLPSDLHFEVGMAALEAGKHLLMEKPLALRTDQCRELCACARDRGRLLAVGFELRLSELWGKLKRLIAAGAVGEPLYALIELWRRPYRLGAQCWRYDIARVGNWVLEEPVHFFDLARWYFADVGEPVSVYARANSRQPGRPELQDNFTAIVQFPRGAYAVIAQTLAAFEHHQTVKITGTRGALWAQWHGALDRDERPSFSLKYFDGQQAADVPISQPAGELFELEREIAMIVRCVRDGTAPAATAEDGAWAVALCEAAQESIRSERSANVEASPPS
jgi:myo-inositol 2-dehydrogenase / D-chiro-inositol 1-dehydrogenase